MSTQIEVTKLNQYAHIGQNAGEAAVTKLNMYARLTPGGGVDTSNRQGHVYAQKIVRD